MIIQIFRSIRKSFCSKLKSYKRSRYRPHSNFQSTREVTCTLEFCPAEKFSQTEVGPTKELCSTNKSCSTVNECTNNVPKEPCQAIVEIEKKNCPGEYTRNPFFNYLRQFRKTHCGLSMVEQAVQAGAEWRCMTNEQKQKYIVVAVGIPKRKRRYKRRCKRRSIYRVQILPN